MNISVLILVKVSCVVVKVVRGVGWNLRYILRCSEKWRRTCNFGESILKSDDLFDGEICLFNEIRGDSIN